MQRYEERQKLAFETAMALTSKHFPRKKRSGNIAEICSTTRNQSPAQNKDHLLQSKPAVLPLEINWQKWTKDDKVNLNHPIISRTPEKRVSNPRIQPLRNQLFQTFSKTAPFQTLVSRSNNRMLRISRSPRVSFITTELYEGFNN